MRLGLGRYSKTNTGGLFSIYSKVNYYRLACVYRGLDTIGLGSIPQQDVFQRVMAAKTENTSVRASYLASGMYLTIAMLPLFIALSAKLLHPDLPKDNQLIIPNMVMRHGSLPLQVLFFGAVTSAILSVSSGAILAPSTVFGENVIKFFRPDISDQAF